MICYRKRYLSMAIALCFATIQVSSVEMMIETVADEPSSVLTQHTSVSIDALVAQYNVASETEAHQIMQQIRKEISRISQERQRRAIERVSMSH